MRRKGTGLEMRGPDKRKGTKDLMRTCERGRDEQQRFQRQLLRWGLYVMRRKEIGRSKKKRIN